MRKRELMKKICRRINECKYFCQRLAGVVIDDRGESGSESCVHTTGDMYMILA